MDGVGDVVAARAVRLARIRQAIAGARSAWSLRYAKLVQGPATARWVQRPCQRGEDLCRASVGHPSPARHRADVGRCSLHRSPAVGQEYWPPGAAGEQPAQDLAGRRLPFDPGAGPGTWTGPNLVPGQVELVRVQGEYVRGRCA